MADTGKIFALFAAVVLVEAFIYNFIKPDLPKIPGDIFIDRWNLRIYIPFVSALILSVILTFVFNFFRH